MRKYFISYIILLIHVNVLVEDGVGLSLVEIQFSELKNKTVLLFRKLNIIICIIGMFFIFFLLVNIK